VIPFYLPKIKINNDLKFGIKTPVILFYLPEIEIKQTTIKKYGYSIRD
jgi:hypothetical protein